MVFFLWGGALWCRVSNSISDSAHQVELSHVVHIQLVLLFQNLNQDGGVLLRDCGVLVEGGGGGQAVIGGTTGALCCLQCPRCYHWLAKRAVEGYHCHTTRAEHTSLRN